ncbi:MAG TPA: nucleotide exchange factor GrpE [Gammaproteobacteria bacterium]|nr:nucleotide exchange factor GrpE [Gammaproteobacteria bacterium]
MAKEEDAVSEEHAAQGSEAEAGAGGATEDLLPLLEDARAKADEHWNQLLRVQADLENTRRRARQDVENAHKFGLEKFALELLPVKDSLEMGLAAISEGNESVEQFKEGVALTLKMLESALEKFGIEAINPLGETFDPEKHQAMSMQESAEHKPNTVMAVMQKGYQLNDRLLRPAMVVVAKATSGAGENESASAVDEQA